MLNDWILVDCFFCARPVTRLKDDKRTWIFPEPWTHKPIKHTLCDYCRDKCLGELEDIVKRDRPLDK